MAVLLSTGLELCFDASRVTPSLVCTIQPELIYSAGLLRFPRYNVGWRAVSGPWGAGPLPLGLYTCDNFRDRTEVAMTRENVGFSVDLTPHFKTHRTLLRIHPDGNKPGTLGCIGITNDVRECRDALKRLLPNKQSSFTLEVQP